MTPDPTPASGPVRASQSLVAGLLLLALCALAVWLTSSLSQGTLRSMGPAMLPRWLAIGVGLCGLALVVAGIVRPGSPLEAWSGRGPVLVVLAILAFAVTIRPVNLGAFGTPGLGLVAAGPLAILIGGYATQEARLRELLVLALALTPFCMVLFGDLLNLPIPIFPQAVADALLPGWSQKGVLRLTAAVMIGAALLVFLLGRSGSPKQAARVDQPVPEKAREI